jgi:hypothetical protein
MNTIKKLNQYLLTNYRLVWETKIVYLLTYLIPSYLLLTAICAIYPISLQNYQADTEDISVSLVVLISVVNTVIFFFWLYKNSQYRIERDFGFNFKFIEQSRFLIYFVGVSLLVIQPFVPAYIIEQKVDGLVSNKELKGDIEILNEGNIYFPKKIETESLNNDNVFFSRNQPIEENAYYESYRYDESYFGNSNYMAEDALEVHFEASDDVKNVGNGSDLEEAEKRIESNKLEEYYKNLISDAMTDENALTKIENYQHLVKKYSYSEVLEKNTPEGIFKSFKLESTVIGGKLNKRLLRNNIENITNAKQRIASSENTYIFLSLLLGAFSLTVLVQIGKHIGLKNFLLSIVFNIGLSMILGFVSALIGFGGGELAVVAPLLVFAFLLFQTLGISRLKTKQSLKVISLSTLQVYSPFFLFYLFSMVGLGNMNAVEFSIFSIITITLGSVIYVAFFLPFFRKMHLCLQALPKE